MSLSLNEKLSRLLSFLVGVRDPQIFAVLAGRGFNKTELKEGWDLFTTAAGARLDPSLPAEGARADAEANSALRALDDWENTWFPVVSASLQRRHPELHAVVFDKLSQTEGRAVIVSVSTLLRRLDALKMKTNGKKALELLESRGFTPTVRKSAEDLLATLRGQGEHRAARVAQPSSEDREKALEDQEKALEAAWAWYLEWSAIARTLITRGDILIRLGLRKQKRAKSTEQKGEEPTPA